MPDDFNPNSESNEAVSEKLPEEPKNALDESIATERIALRSEQPAEVGVLTPSRVLPSRTTSS